MPPSITVSKLTWLTPDGTDIFSELDLRFTTERVGLIGRNGTGKTTLLRLIAGDLTPTSGHIHVAGRLAFLRQIIMQTRRDRISDLFGITDELARLERAENGTATLDDLSGIDWTLPTRLETALARCDLASDPRTPLSHLSGGQRARAALAAMIYAEPDFLLLDEPTNNLDRAGRDAVLDLIRTWSKGLIIVSHDRDVLQDMDAIIEITPLGATRYGGAYSHYVEQKEIELEASQRTLSDAQKHLADIAQKTRIATERKARKDSRGRLSRRGGGQAKSLLDAAKERAETSGGSGVRLRDARRQAAEDALDTARDRVETIRSVKMDILPTGLPRSRQVLQIDGLSGGFDPERPVIRDIHLDLTGPERVHLKGPNGSGKTTVLKLVTGALQPFQGSLTLHVRWALLDQHHDQLKKGFTLLRNYQRLSPQATSQHAYAALARFGFRAEDALRTPEILSGGERLRATLACTLGATPPPELLILDEPTNHLDLDSILALETALKAYDGALIVVSHDQRFVQALDCTKTLDLGEESLRCGRENRRTL